MRFPLSLTPIETNIETGSFLFFFFSFVLKTPSNGFHFGDTVGALVSGHLRGAKKVSVTGAGRLRECEHTEFVWDFNKSGF